MAGLALNSMRLPHSPVDGEPDDDAAIAERYAPVEVDLSGDISPVDPETATKVETSDGGVVVFIGRPRIKKKNLKFSDNLALTVEEPVLGAIADELLKLIEQDNESRREWLETRARGIEIMGLKIEPMRSSGADGSAPLEGQSQSRATLLCEAVVRFGANAFSELVPTDGPAKVAEDTSGSYPALDDLADALEKDLNHYVMTVDKPWVPDTDSMLLRIGVDGSVFKKVYHDAILRRPISRAVYGEDLIVNNSANSLFDAGRVTHRVFMRKSMVRRMQLVGAYRDVHLGDPGFPVKSPQELQTEEIAGIRKNDLLERDDRDREMFESYCELDIPGFEHEVDGEASGLPLPYKVTIDKESRQVLEIRRNWNEDDEMCLPKTWFVQYSFLRGFGFYGIGLSHLLGNTTNTLTAAQREFIDAAMFACFPGLLIQKGAGRQNNSIFRVPPGGAAEIETGGMPIGEVVMGMPYKPPDAISVSFMQALESAGQRLGGTAEVMVGEGRQDAPVGTTLALIEQAIKPLMATHKRLCASQSDELQLLVERFREDPESFVRASRMLKPKKTGNPEMPSQLSWDEQLFLQAINENQIVTRADPNTASHLQRMLRNAALYQMAKDEPPAFDTKRIRQICIRGIGFNNPDQFLAQNPAPPPPDPKAQAAQLSAQASMLDAQTRAGQLAFDQRNAPQEAQQKSQEAQTKVATSHMALQKQQLATQTAGIQAQNEAQKPAMERQKQQFEGGQNQLDRMHEGAMALREQAAEARLQAADQMHERQMGAQDHMHEQAMGAQQQQGEMLRSAREQQTQMMMAERGHQHEAAMGARDQQFQAHREMQGQEHERQMGARDQAHEASMAERSQAHEGLMGRQEHRSRLAEVKAKPPPQASRPIHRADGGPVNSDFDSPYGRARQAPDGFHYVQHPGTGQFFRIRRRGRPR